MKKSQSSLVPIVAGAAAFIVAVAPMSPLVAATIVADVEAEDATLDGMRVVEIAGINGIVAESKYEGSAQFVFNAPTSGMYEVRAKTVAPDRRHDSFLFGIGDQALSVWHVPNTASWNWSVVTTEDNPTGTYALEAGEHVLTFSGRELTTLDRIQVVRIEDRAEVPEAQEDESVGSEGAVHHVAVDGRDVARGTDDDPYSTIQDALAVARAGDVVLVAPGVYRDTFTTQRAGASGAPIIIRAAQTGAAVIDLDWKRNAPRFEHSNYVFEGFEVRNFREGIRIEGASHVTVRNNKIHHGENECVRVRYFATHNVIAGNSIHFCGATSPYERLHGGNGEGIYIGTAPEQREKNGNSPDASVHNIIEGNTIYDVTEGVDVKEDASYTTVRSNTVYGASDANSGAINVRGDRNTVLDNASYGNAGSGFRFGGDAGIRTAEGILHDYGEMNVIRRNVAHSNEQYGYKVMRDKQQVNCSNRTDNNTRGDTSANVTWCFAS